VETLLGEGGSKRVYLARDTRLERDVALALIKTEQLDVKGVARVRREAQAMARLGDHPHIVTVYDVGEDGPQPYIVSQYMAGGALDDLLRRAASQRLPISQVLSIGGQIATALEYAHTQSIVHRDLKPSNVWLTLDGTAKLGDFGLAVALDRSRLTVGDMMVGTFAYMAPEQAQGRPPDARSDLYALGVMLYEMLTGRPPFLGSPAAVIAQHINAPPEALSRHVPEVPRALEALILRLLAKTPQERPATAAVVHETLAAISSRSKRHADARVPEGVEAAIPVTLLFTDLVGSTMLLQRVGDEKARAMIQAHHEHLKDAVAAHGGHEVKWLGDGLMVVFSSAAGAVHCAIAMQRATRPHVAGERLEIRVGLNVGEALRDEADYFGTPVVVARRLCDAARPGQILCSYLVTGLLAGRRAFRFQDLGRLTLKGIAQPVRVSEVLYGDDMSRPDAPDAAASPEGDGPLPLPTLLAPTEQFAFVGRRSELDVLIGAWRDTAAGTRRLVLIHGEPGIGKTRLAAETARVVHAAGGTVLFGRCDEEIGVPFQPFVEALDHFALHTPDNALPERLGRHAGELVRVQPDIALRVPGLPPRLQSDPETERYRLFDAVAGWLCAAAAARPILLVIDDVHWAGKPTLHMLRHVVAACAPARLMIIGTLRDTEVSPGHPLGELLADLRPVAGVEQLALRGLDEAGVVELLEEVSGQVVDAVGRTFARAVHADTAGNPFFVGEVLRHLVESDAIVQQGGRWMANIDVSNMGIPAAVRDVVLRRIRRLSRTASEALTFAAAIGRHFDVGILGAVSGLEEDALLAALDEAVAARLVDETAVDTYRFTHVLVRSALYDGLSASRRVRLHRRVGEAMEARDVRDVTALAYHFTEAGHELVRKAIDYTTLAGDQALARLAHDQAVHFYRRALELVDNSNAGNVAERCELLTRLGTAEKSAGDRAYRETLLVAARLAQHLGDTGRLVRAALANNRGWVSTSGEVDVERVAVLESALAAAEERDGAARAMLLATLAAELVYADDRPRRVALSDAALAMARRIDDPVALAHVLNLRSHVIWAPDTLAERLANTAEHVAIAERLQDPLVRWYASATRPQACMEAGDIAEVDRHLALLWELTDELGRPHQRWAATIDRAWRELLRGRIDAAEALVTEAYEIGTASGQGDALGYYTVQLTAVRFEQGRLGELVSILEPVVVRRPRIPLLERTLALAYCEAGRADDARRILDAAFASRFGSIPLDIVWLTEMTLYAEVATRLGAAAPAALLYERLAPWPNHVVFNGVYVFGSISHTLGLLAKTLCRYDEAAAHFALAARVHEKIGAPTLLARTRLEWAHMLLGRVGGAEATHARTLLGDVLMVARDLGLASIERRVNVLLAT